MRHFLPVSVVPDGFLFALRGSFMLAFDSRISSPLELVSPMIKQGKQKPTVKVILFSCKTKYANYNAKK